MNLFEYIADNLTQNQKRQLYREKSVCLCLFRVAFGSDSTVMTKLETDPGQDQSQIQPAVAASAYCPPGLQQQLIYRLIFTRDPSAQDGAFTKNEIMASLHARPKTSMSDSSTYGSMSMAVGQGVSTLQAEREAAEAKNAQNLLCDRFLRKLLKLQIASEVPQNPPSGTLTAASPMPIMTPLVNTGLARVSSLQLGKSISHQQEPPQEKKYHLNADFHTNILSLLSTNFELGRIKKTKLKKLMTADVQAELDKFEAQAKDKWDRIIQIILNILPQNQNEGQLLSDRFVIDLLLRGKYIEPKLTQQSSASTFGQIMLGGPASSQSQYQMTVNGFQYVLMDASRQAQHLLLNYIQSAESRGQISPVELIQFIFTLSLTEPKSIYKLKKTSGGGSMTNDAQIIRDLSNFGLIEILPSKKVSSKSLKFYVTQLMQQFLIQQTGQAMGGGSLGNAVAAISSTVLDESILSQNSKLNSDKFLIVETNFKVYAYTSSRVYLALFRHLMRVEYAFNNFIVATITRSNLQPAFERGITAKQVIDFLEAHAHVNARLNKMAMMQNQLSTGASNMNASGSAYFDYTSASRSGSNIGTQNGNTQASIAELFGLASAKGKMAKPAASSYSVNGASGSSTEAEYVPPNVRQQIELWEKELNCLRTRNAMMIILNSQDMAKRFLQYALSKGIAIFKQNLDEPNKKIIVIDIKYEKEAMEFQQGAYK